MLLLDKGERERMRKGTRGGMRRETRERLCGLGGTVWWDKVDHIMFDQMIYNTSHEET
jgi:hypothetical protein